MNELADAIGEDAPDAPSDDSISKISNLVKEQVALEDQIASLSEDLKARGAKLRELSEQHIPAAMLEAGVKNFTTDDGLEVDVREKMSASVSKKNKPKVVAWLREHGHGSLVKNLVSATFGRDEDEDAVRALNILTDSGFEARQDVDVNTTTLKAFVKEQLEAGEEIPLELFGVYVYNSTTIKRK
tara:strand:+ start:9056 stop:9610 length:555 start_codon:yes stop_codon:yes gene_type:complete